MTDISKADRTTRLIAIIPVILIAGAMIAFMAGTRLEGRRHGDPIWRTHAVAEHNFTVGTPGVVIVHPAAAGFAGTDAPARTYVASDRGADFTVTVVRLPESDARSPEDVAKSLGVADTASPQRAGALTVFRHDVAQDGERTEARVIFSGRMLYQLRVASPEVSFPAADASRFFESFKIGP